ncbi:MAG TPA: DUF3159 domain-containing protein [Nocardioidaceae bacterium]|nr:DUF3159 domain-containing protein [Nocardioidaceae bacterium]
MPEQPAGATVPVPQTVEAVVRTQLSNALGGKRGVLESALPTIAFTLTWVTTHQLKPALLAGAAAAVLLLAVRVAQRQPVQYVLNAVVGIGIAAIFALRSGRAEDAFLPGILYNAGYAVVLAVSVLVRWPAVGFLIGAVTGDPTGWRSNPAVVSLCAKLTWLLALPCALRVVVQYPLWATGQVGWLGAAKLALGWPLQVAAFAAIAWLLTRNHTPLEPRTAPSPG